VSLALDHPAIRLSWYPSLTAYRMEFILFMTLDYYGNGRDNAFLPQYYNTLLGPVTQLTGGPFDSLARLCLSIAFGCIVQLR